MRKIFVIAALVGAMFIVDYFQTEHVAGFALAAIGFVILASYTTADLGSSALKLPKVTGYIIAGILLGPYVFNILSTEVVEELKMFNTLALGLIALNAGLELSIEGIKRISRILFTTIGLKLLTLPIFVGGTVYSLATFYPSILGVELDSVTIICLSLLFSAFAIGTSPAIAIAVSNEMNSKGRSTEVILGAAIFKDLVVVVSLAIVIAVCKSILDSSAEFSINSLMYVVEKLGFSLLIGLSFGFIIIAYVRYVKFQMLLFIFCTILAAAEIAQILHGDLLLVFICAGFIVRNFSKYEHDVLEPMNLVSLPTFVIFFTIAGAAINLQRTLTLIGFTLAIVVARIVAFYVSSYFAAKINNEPDIIRKKLWLGYISQAGVTLGLVGLAGQQLPVLSDWILDLGVAFVAINLLLGPIGLRFAISHEAADASDAALTEVSGAGGEPTAPLPAPDLEDSPLNDPVLIEILQTFRKDLNKTFCSSIDRFSETYRNTIESSLVSTLDPKLSEYKRAENLVAWTQLYSQKTFKINHNILENFLSKVEASVLELEVEYQGPIDPETLKVAPGDSLVTRARKYLFPVQNLFVSKSRKLRRIIPLRSIVRTHIDVRMAEYALSLQLNFLQLKFNVFEQIMRLCQQTIDADRFMDEIDQVLEYFKRVVEDDFRLILNQQTQHMGESLHRFGTPATQSRDIVAAAEREPKRKQILDQLLERKEEIEEIYTVFVEQITLFAMKAQINLRLDNMVRSTFVEGLQTVASRYCEVMQSVVKGLNESLHKLSVDVEKKVALEDVVADLVVEVEKLKFAELTKITKKFQMDTSTHRASLQFKKIAALINNRFKILGPASITSDGFSFKNWTAQQVDFYDILREHLINDFSLTLDSRISSFKDHLEHLSELFQQIKEIFDFDELLENEDFANHLDTDLKTYLINSIKVSITRINEAHESLKTLEGDTSSLLLDSFNATVKKIDGDLNNKPFTRTAINKVNKWQRQIDDLLIRYENQQIVRLPLTFFASMNRGWHWLRKFKFRPLLEADRTKTASVVSHQFIDIAALNSAKFKEMEAQNPLFKKGFTLEPLRDRKYFTLNQESLSYLISQYKNWQDELPAASCLVIGAAGTGKTSLLNVFQNSIADDKLIRLDASQGSHRGKFLRKLSVELECLPTLKDITNSLRAKPRVIVVDDFEEWFAIDLRSLVTLTNALNLIQSTRNQSLWVVATNPMFHDFYKNSHRLDHCFHGTIQMQPLSNEQTKSLLETRLAYTGLQMELTKLNVRFVKGGLIINGSDRIFFRALRRVSSGRIYNVIGLWLQSLQIHDHRSVSTSVQQLFEFGNRSLRHLTPLQLSILIVLYRHGPISQQELLRAIEIPGVGLTREISSLRHSQYLEPVGRKKQILQLKKISSAALA